MENVVVQLRGLNEVVYCEKLFHLMYAQGLFQHSADTVEGKMHHNKREESKSNIKLDGADLFSIVLYGMSGSLSGKLDGIILENDEYVPVEDKNSKPPETEFEFNLWNVKIKTPVWVNDFPQLVGQMYLLRKNGYNCNRGRMYYRKANKMIEVVYKDEYDVLIENGVSHCKEILKGEEPGPLVDSDKCIRCSLNWACLPDESNVINKVSEEPRRLYPGRPDTSILYVTSVGSKISKSGECLVVWTPELGSKNIPIKDIEDVCVFGNVQVTTQAMQTIIKNNGSIYYFTSGGWFTAMTSAPITKNIQLRINQFRKFGDEDFCTALIKNLVAAKIANQRTLLRRNLKTSNEDALLKMNNCRKAALKSDSIDSVRGYEGNAANIYWEAFPFMINERDIWEMKGRNRRPPKDEINAMLSYGYSLLLRDFISAITQCGLDYLYGFYHSIVPGRPALALDMMEPYRPLLVDSVVLRLLNEKIVVPEQFHRTKAGVYMSPEVKKKLIHFYELRLDEMITHPTFGYRLSYRRMIHLEAKLLGKYIIGELNEYYPLTTR